MVCVEISVHVGVLEVLVKKLQSFVLIKRILLCKWREKTLNDFVPLSECIQEDSFNLQN